MQAGAVISAIFHSGLLLLLVIGETRREMMPEDEMAVADVSLISLEEFEELRRSGPPVELDNLEPPVATKELPQEERTAVEPESVAVEPVEVPEQPDAPAQAPSEEVPQPSQPLEVSNPAQEPDDLQQDKPAGESDPLRLVADGQDQVELIAEAIPETLESARQPASESEVPVPVDEPVQPQTEPVAAEETKEELTELADRQQPEMISAPISRPRRRPQSATGPEVVPEPEPEPKPVPEPELEPEPEPKPEPEPEPKPEPEPEPEPKPEPEPEPMDEPSIADLISKVVDDSVETIAEEGSSRNTGPPLTANERDGLRRRIEKCWNIAALPDEARWFTITVSAELDRNGRPLPESIKLNGADGGSPEARQKAFEVARRAIRRCLNDGHSMPAEKYQRWRRLEITFNPEEMRIR